MAHVAEGSGSDYEEQGGVLTFENQIAQVSGERLRSGGAPPAANVDLAAREGSA
jgi:hypothetical protein